MLFESKSNNYSSQLPIYDGSREPLITGMINDFYFGIDGLGDTGYRPPPVTLAGVQAAMTLSELSKKYPGRVLFFFATCDFKSKKLRQFPQFFFLTLQYFFLNNFVVGSRQLNSF